MSAADSLGAIDAIRVRGARTHNLRGVDLDIPRYCLVVVTGLSGSGKSSLAFDTLYAEGQRRYVESLSAYARQFLEQMERPDVESVEGLSPAIAIEQKTTSRNPRSTVGTVTELYDYLRLLFARVGTPHCPRCGRAVRSQTTRQIVNQVMSLAEGSRLQILGPVVRSRKGEFKAELTRLARSGFVRARIDGRVLEIHRPPALQRNQRHDIEVVVDRVIMRPGIETRIRDAVDKAVQVGDGVVIVNVLGDDDYLYSKKLACAHCEISVPEPMPRSFSFNSPRGACSHCEGLGRRFEFDPALVMPDDDLSLPDGAVAPWRGSAYPKHFFAALCNEFEVDPATPWGELPEALRRLVLDGPPDDEPLEIPVKEGLLDKRLGRDFEGVIPILEDAYATNQGGRRGRKLEKFMRDAPCRACGGDRLRPESLAVLIDKRSIADFTALTIDGAVAAVGEMKFGRRLEPVAGPLVKEIGERMHFLQQVGLGYLTLDRPAASLAGGESQRIRLATQIGTRLRGVMYVLDEPSIGLHQRDNDRLLEALAEIRDQGNTVIVVEHDEDTIRFADWVIDLGPGAGEHGGWVVAEGPPEAIAANEQSLTGDYLAGRRRIEVPDERRKPAPRGLFDAADRDDSASDSADESEAEGVPDDRAAVITPGWVTVCGARHHNLQDIDVSFPLGLFTVVTGVSGSGKSSLVQEILYRELARVLYRAVDVPGEHDAIDGIELIDKVIDITQDPIGRSPRSNPATYTGAFTPIRQLFASLPESKVRGYEPGRFSFNVVEGRCAACEGAGVRKIEMHFLPDVYAPCEECNTRRYNDETLQIHYHGHNIAEVLDLTVEHALELFGSVPAIARRLQSLVDVGLGYLTLGQSATTLSGGEAQRVKLAKELSKRATGSTIYILDEPTTGLHFEDVRRLLDVLDQLVEQGNTVIVIEHNLEVVKYADWIIDLGPEGGDEGGVIVVEGSPESVAEHPTSHTARYLRGVLAGEKVTA
ncbi:MAG: excinuclease ABC subunit UvrA [Acidobacteriota bacterium]|jgi:excinuclease ABC subunit A